jgi:hypothetical protein
MSIHLDHTFDQYHSDPSFGSSTAKLATKSLQLVRDRLDGIDTVPDRPHFQIGSIIHLAVLEPAKFAACVVSDGPINDKTGKPYGRDTQKFSDWQAANPDKMVVEPWIHTLLARMPAEVKEILKTGVAEASIYQTAACGLPVKCRPDHLVDTAIWHLKTCLDIDRLERDIQKFEYWFADSWYRAVMLLETGKKHQSGFIFAEKKPPFRWRIAKIDADYAMYGDEVVAKTIGRLQVASVSGDWQDHDEISVMVSRPDWMGDEIDEYEETNKE